MDIGETDPRETAEWWWGGKSHGVFDRLYEYNEDDDPADRPLWNGRKKKGTKRHETD